MQAEREFSNSRLLGKNLINHKHDWFEANDTGVINFCHQVPQSDIFVPAWNWKSLVKEKPPYMVTIINRIPANIPVSTLKLWVCSIGYSQHRAPVFLFDFSPEQKFHGDDYLYSAKWSQNYSVSVVCWNRSRAWRIRDWRRWKSHLRGGCTEEDVEAVAEGGVDDWQSGTQLSETGERWGARCGRGGRKRVDIVRATFFGLTLLGQHLLSWHYEGNICWMSPTLLPIYITAHI